MRKISFQTIKRYGAPVSPPPLLTVSLARVARRDTVPVRPHAIPPVVSGSVQLTAGRRRCRRRQWRPPDRQWAEDSLRRPLVPSTPRGGWRQTVCGGQGCRAGRGVLHEDRITAPREATGRLRQTGGGVKGGHAPGANASNILLVSGDNSSAAGTTKRLFQSDWRWMQL